MVWSLGEKGCGRLGIRMQKYGLFCNMAFAENARKGRPKKRWNEVVKDDLRKCGLDRDLAKDSEMWKAQVIGKASDLCEKGQGT